MTTRPLKNWRAAVGASAIVSGVATPPRTVTRSPSSSRRSARRCRGRPAMDGVVMHRRGSWSVFERASCTALRTAAFSSTDSAVPSPAVMSTVSETKRASVTESSRKPRTDDISPMEVEPMMSVWGYASANPELSTSGSVATVENSSPALGDAPSRPASHCATTEATAAAASMSSLCPTTMRNMAQDYCGDPAVDGAPRLVVSAAPPTPSSARRCWQSSCWTNWSCDGCRGCGGRSTPSTRAECRGWAGEFGDDQPRHVRPGSASRPKMAATFSGDPRRGA